MAFIKAPTTVVLPVGLTSDLFVETAHEPADIHESAAPRGNQCIHLQGLPAFGAVDEEGKAMGYGYSDNQMSLYSVNLTFIG